MSVGTKVVISFICGAAVGGLAGYYFSSNAFDSTNKDVEALEAYYEDKIAELKAKYSALEEKNNEKEERYSEVPIDPLDRVTDADSHFTDYAAIASKYWGDDSVKEEKESKDIQKPVKEEPKEEKVFELKKPERKKLRHKPPVESITDEEFNDLCNNDSYSVRQYYLDGDIWTRLNSDDYRDDISVDDFPIQLEDFRWSKSGIAYFVNHESKQLYKFHNAIAY